MVRRIVWGILLALTVLVNVIAWNSTAFCDWFVKHLFPLSVNVYGRFTSLFSVSVGERLIVVGILLVLLAVLAVPLRFLARQERLRLFLRRFHIFFAWVLLIVCMVMTYNCTILYHASAFDQIYMPESADQQYTDEELILVRDHIVEQLNGLVGGLERDENGLLLYDGDLNAVAVSAMKSLGEEYGQLAGYYPQAKAMTASHFMSQEYMMGYYFPFSMEANYNDVMYIVNKPVTICHELSHLKGFLYEDDANFIGYLACIRSEDPFFQYSGYLSVLTYVEKEFKNAIDKDAEVYAQHVQIAEQVSADDIFLTEEAWEQVEEKAVVETQTVKQAANTFTDTTLKVNGVSDGMKSYSRVVQLLLQYYDGKLYERYVSLT